MRSVKFTAFLAAASLAIAPAATYAAPTVAPSARVGATMSESNDLNGSSRSAQIALGFLLLVAILAIVVAGDDERPDNLPESP